MQEITLFYILVIVCFVTHILRSVYELLKHKQILKPNKLSFVIIFINMGLLWMSWFTLCTLDPCKTNLPGIIRYAGLLLFIAGIILFFTALLTIKTLESYEGDLMTKGIYSIIRHPMYLGFIFWLIGFPVFQGALFSLFPAFLFIGNVLFWRSMEEKELERRFPNYEGYRKRTLF